MKIGVSLPSYYEEYLKKIANLNNLTMTKVCGLILENFLSFNLNQKKFPIFRNSVRIFFDEESSENSVDHNSGNSGSRSVDKNCESLKVKSRDELIKENEEFEKSQHVDTEIHDDNWMPF